jgi:hypothetical protein
MRSSRPAHDLERQMKRRNRKQELLQRAQFTKAHVDSLNLKGTDRVTTPVAAAVLCKHEVTLRAWRSAEGRGPPFFKDPTGKSVLYKVQDLWDWTEKNTVDPAKLSPEQKLLYMFSKSATAERIRFESDKHPDDLAPEVFEDDGDDVEAATAK